VVRELGKFVQCVKCGTWSHTGVHICPPSWECRSFPDVREWTVVYAVDANRAAERFAKLRDRFMDLMLAQAEGDFTVRVEVRAERWGEEKIQRFRVGGTMVPTYMADRMLEDSDAKTLP